MFFNFHFTHNHLSESKVELALLSKLANVNLFVCEQTRSP